ncbi:MAG TPA: peptide chain release factor N(5)-glutamine methyltransferase [Candidatus Baltobacteraceae bacterium]|nr:peptide chain release factor N(5)-glutamine methyltransferase [Candidatus Baltobacteraceae bacterium]
MTVRELAASAADRLKRARILDARREAESLLAHALAKDETWVVAHPEAPLAPAKAKAYAAMVARRAAHEPFAYVVGEKWFYGRRFRVTKDVLIPRPETETLVEAVLARAPDGAAVKLLDVGTGSGAIGLTLAAGLPKAHGVLYDISKKALDVARANVRALKLGRRIRLVRLDITRQPLPEPKDGVTIIAANLPYLPVAAWKKAAPEVRLREPKLALVSGADGLDHYRALFKRLARWKRPPDLLALEAEPGQFAELRRSAGALMPDADVAVLKDLYGDERVLIAEKRKRPVA